mmetsp:Transcript_2984/g.7090  ORF Transcript_2984/g.7090 Transcript_2984/m.7090 type:complete len:287 (+) Transcript_2984:245-1105(+)
MVLQFLDSVRKLSRGGGKVCCRRCQGQLLLLQAHICGSLELGEVGGLLFLGLLTLPDGLLEIILDGLQHPNDSDTLTLGAAIRAIKACVWHVIRGSLVGLKQTLGLVGCGSIKTLEGGNRLCNSIAASLGLSESIGILLLFLQTVGGGIAEVVLKLIDGVGQLLCLHLKLALDRLQFVDVLRDLVQILSLIPPLLLSFAHLRVAPAVVLCIILRLLEHLLNQILDETLDLCERILAGLFRQCCQRLGLQLARLRSKQRNYPFLRLAGSGTSQPPFDLTQACLVILG